MLVAIAIALLAAAVAVGAASFTSKRQHTQALQLGFSVLRWPAECLESLGCSALWPISSILISVDWAGRQGHRLEERL